MDWLVKFFQDGGNLMYVNLLVMVFALAIVFERAFMLMFKYRMDTKAFMSEIEKALGAGNMPKAKKLCKDQVGPMLPRVIFSALNASYLGPEATARAIDESKAEVSPHIGKRTNMLWPIANIATLIGLVGTVFGLIQAFAAVNSVTGAEKSALLTAGIAHAMNNTAWGLTIALICTFAHMVLSAISKGLNEDLEFASLKIENLLARLMAERAKGAAAGSES